MNPFFLRKGNLKKAKRKRERKERMKEEKEEGASEREDLSPKFRNRYKPKSLVDGAAQRLLQLYAISDCSASPGAPCVPSQNLVSSCTIIIIIILHPSSPQQVIIYKINQCIKLHSYQKMPARDQCLPSLFLHPSYPSYLLLSYSLCL